MADIEITDVSPASFSQDGGTELTITLAGVIAVPGDIQVFVDGVICYGGQGYGNTPTTDGLTVKVYSPLLTSKGSVAVTVQQGAVVSNSFAVTVLERVWRGKQFGIRQAFPSWYAVGNRRLDEEGPL